MPMEPTVNITERVCNFLYREASLLDSRRYREWLELLEPSLYYKVAVSIHRNAQDDKITHSVIEGGFDIVKARVDQISNPRLTHAENPPTITRRLVSNVIVTADQNDPDTVAVESVLFMHRIRPDRENRHFYSGARSDRFLLADKSMKLIRREVTLDHAVLDGGVSVIF